MNQHTDDWRGEHLIRVPRREKPELKVVVKHAPKTGAKIGARSHGGAGSRANRRPEWMVARDKRIAELAAEGHGVMAMERIIGLEHPEWRASYHAIRNVCDRDEIDIATAKKKARAK